MKGSASVELCGRQKYTKVPVQQPRFPYLFKKAHHHASDNTITHLEMTKTDIDTTGSVFVSRDKPR